MKKDVRKIISNLLIVALILSNISGYNNFSYAENIENTDDALEIIDENISTDSNTGVIEETDIEEEYEYVDEPEDDISTDSEIEEDTFLNLEVKEEIDEETEDENIATDSEIFEEVATDSEIEVESSPIIATESSFKLDLMNEKDIIATPSEEKNFGFMNIDISIPMLKETNNGLFRSAELLTSYDARTEINNAGMSIVPPISNQGSYGMCWAFSTIGMMETSIRKKNYVTTEEEANLSETVLAYFFYHLDSIYGNSANKDKPGLEGEDYMSIIDEDTNPSHILSPSYKSWAQIGGNQLNATLTMSSYMGATVENDDTKIENINAPGGIATNGLDGKYAFNSNAYEIANVQYINCCDTNAIKKAILENGSVGISYYEKDMFSKMEGGKHYYLTNEMYKCNHAVMVVGWDDEIPASKFSNSYNTATHNGGWLVRNSWGAGSRDGGYFWMSYDEPSIYEVVFSVEAIKANTYKYNYHYDTTGSSWSADYDAGAMIGNIYKVNSTSNQKLEAVSVAFRSTNANFDVKIYSKDSPMTKPNDGTLRTTQNVVTTTAGIYTIPLNEPVILDKNAYYSIVISMKNHVDIFKDLSYSDESLSVDFVNKASEGQSFECFGADYWYDKNDDGNNSNFAENIDGENFRIKGLTNPTDDEPNFPAPEPAQPSGPVPANPISGSSSHSGGSGGGGGGDGGGGSRGALNNGAISPLTNGASLNQTDAKVIASRGADTNLFSVNVSWIFDPITSAWSLNIDKANPALKANNGFYNILTTDQVSGIVKNDVYYFDVNGNMVTGWVKDASGTFYFFETNQGNDIGKMTVGWNEIGQGKFYFFGTDGKLLTNSYTPDGKYVGADGQYVVSNI